MPTILQPNLKRVRIYDDCINNVTLQQKQIYCNNKFKGSAHKIKGCNKDFCTSCCHKQVPWVNTNLRYSCYKKCSRLKTKQSTRVNGKSKNWLDFCINVKSDTPSIYDYCSEKFPTMKYELGKCKLDACKMCCVSFDAWQPGTKGFSNTNSCFISCEIKFKRATS